MFIILLVFSLLSCGLQAEQAKCAQVKSVDPQGYYLTLDDGSFWAVNWTNSWTSYYWKVGQKVCVEKAENRGDDFRLSNLDHGWHIFARRVLSREKYHQVISKIRKNARRIEMKNGAIWGVYPGYEEEVRKWQEGDEIQLSLEWDFLAKEFSYSFVNLRTLTVMPVEFFLQDTLYGTAHLEDVQWSYIQLSDGSKWGYIRLLEQTQGGWNKSDRIAIFADASHPNQFVLFNYDSYWYSRAPIPVTPWIDPAAPTQ